MASLLCRIYPIILHFEFFNCLNGVYNGNMTADQGMVRPYGPLTGGFHAFYKYVSPTGLWFTPKGFNIPAQGCLQTLICHNIEATLGLQTLICYNIEATLRMKI